VANKVLSLSQNDKDRNYAQPLFYRYSITFARNTIHVSSFLFFAARRYACAVYAVAFVCPSQGRTVATKLAKLTITQAPLHNSTGTTVFWCLTYW